MIGDNGHTVEWNGLCVGCSSDEDDDDLCFGSASDVECSIFMFWFGHVVEWYVLCFGCSSDEEWDVLCFGSASDGSYRTVFSLCYCVR